MTETIPKHFVPLQELGYDCLNYYFGEGGRRIGIKREFLSSIGITNDYLWVHPDILGKLAQARKFANEKGFDFKIKDAFRPKLLIQEICKLRRTKNMEVEKIISVHKMPHATGMAVDVVLCEFFEYDEGFHLGEEVYMRNPAKDGLECSFVEFYRGKTDADSINFQNVQDVLINSFMRAGFVLGNRNEIWHFEMPHLEKATRY